MSKWDLDNFYILKTTIELNLVYIATFFQFMFYLCISLLIALKIIKKDMVAAAVLSNFKNGS